MSGSLRVRKALLMSDLHLGWTVCSRLHWNLMERLREAVDDAELIVLNGDIIDVYRPSPRGLEAEIIARFVEVIEALRAEGRQVVYVEGNHDHIEHRDHLPIAPDRWRFDFEGANGERIRVLHGHRFSGDPYSLGSYEKYGRHLLRLENDVYGKIETAHRTYPAGMGWLVGAVGWTEDMLWTRDFPGRVKHLLPDTDVLVHGHFHFGKGHWHIGKVPLYRTGAWVSHGHLGSVDRMLRYRDGRFERIGLGARGFEPTFDGR